VKARSSGACANLCTIACKIQLFDEAVTHALAIPEVEHAARLIEQHGWSTNYLSQFQVLLGWLDRLSDVFVRSQPSLCIIHAVMLMLSHQLERAAARIQDAERCLEEILADQRRSILGVIAASRGTLARLLGNYERGVPLAQQALDLLPTMEETLLRRLVYPTTLLTATSAYLVAGDLTPATERMSRPRWRQYVACTPSRRP
jgi:ATP/maltotriose-dependent transcriptional regulator MalT